jgi:hypothetical protein
MIVEAGLEHSNVTDQEHGLPVMISTTARMFFREQFPDQAKTRNWVVNQYLAGMFGNGSISTYFRPREGDADDVGEIREVGGGRMIGIVSKDHVRVIAIKGGLSGALPALSPQAGATGEDQAQGEALPTPEADQQVGEALQGAT